ncbi:ACP phosphodiesterase [Geobacter sp. SVR]|uniref:acyl carrier protein phosphodiesterase n=1 Tax=Geobacter sp. SVR TaxID=2495594 RepID=UPI00143EFB96|nr:ACP phosphodiesterase [Geobacter sp. SVR]BCS52154.1 ACP phosphodiesterase [Geobacter sp. SVR]GCF86609.1 ACP phosphodiesterase [Geobacter sp. SVR]
MNFLFHLLLSGDDGDLLTGNFMGDFVKGPLVKSYPEGIEQGLRLHRGIDAFAERSLPFRHSRQMLSPHYGLYRGVLVDLFYDHFLVVEWIEWSPESFESYLVRARSMVERNREWLPPNLQSLVPIIFEELLPSYREISGIGRALERMAQRVRRPNPLAGGQQELVEHYQDLRDDFHSFMPQVRRFVRHFANGAE